MRIRGRRATAHLLLLEDDPHLQVLYRLELNHAGHVVRMAATLAQAVRELKSHPPALILLEMHLPDADGQLTLSTILREAPAHIPIVVNSAYSRYRKNVPRDRKIAYVLKSSDLTELHRVIERSLNETPARGALRRHKRVGKRTAVRARSPSTP